MPSASSGPHEALRLHVLGHLAKRHLAQCGEVLDLEEAVERRGDPVRGIHLALAQALNECLWSEVHQDNLVRGREDAIGEGLANAHAGQVGDAVVQALQVLHVDGGIDVHAGVQNVVDVLIALGVLDARGVRVRKLVDEAELGRPLEDRRQVHFLEGAPSIFHLAPGDDLEPLGLRGGLRAPVCLEDSHHNVAAVGLFGLALLEHAVCLADPCRHAEEDLVVASPGLRHRGAFSLSSGAEQVVDDQVHELDAHEGRDQAAEAVDQQVPPKQRGGADGAVANTS